MKKIIIVMLMTLISTTTILGVTVEELMGNVKSIKANIKDDKAIVNWQFKSGIECDSVVVYRSYSPMEIPLDRYLYPIRKNTVTGKSVFSDQYLASNVDYYYKVVGYLNGELAGISDNCKISVSGDSLRTVDIDFKNVHIEIDKVNYLLSIKNNDTTLKSYPIAMGGNPFNRKIIRDNESSPEGIYNVVYIQRNATYYKALDINYPNTIDRVRFDVAKQTGMISQSDVIGGEIQIHGKGIYNNWTFGCFALRNDDIDEILDSKLIRRGTNIVIFGYEIEREDLGYIFRYWPKSEVKVIQRKLRDQGYKVGSDGVLGPNSRRQLGKFQKDNGLAVTCDLDKDTCKKLGYIPSSIKNK